DRARDRDRPAGAPGPTASRTPETEGAAPGDRDERRSWPVACGGVRPGTPAHVGFSEPDHRARWLTRRGLGRGGDVDEVSCRIPEGHRATPPQLRGGRHHPGNSQPADPLVFGIHVAGPEVEHDLGLVPRTARPGGLVPGLWVNGPGENRTEAARGGTSV